MGQMLIGARALLRQRVVLVLAVVWIAVGVLAQLLPLASLPGYELALILSVTVGLSGGVLGIAAARAAPRSPALVPPELVHASVLALAVLAVPFAIAALSTALTTPCDPFATALFVPLLVVPSVLATVALGGLAGRVARRWRGALGLWIAVIFSSAVHTAVPLIWGPQVFAFNHLGGYFPGPLYDERLEIPAGLWWFRGGTLLLAVAAASLSSAHPRRGRVAALCLAGLVAVELAGPSLGFRASDASLEGALGQTIAGPHTVVHLARTVPPEHARRIAEEVEFRAAQIIRFMGAAPQRPVTVWWYPSEDEKKRLVGAGRTQFARPWEREVHVNDAPLPHPVLRHELVHAMAASWGAAPFGVPSRLWGLKTYIGVVEGLAEAADDPARQLHVWAAAMKKKGLLPSVSALMSPAGFYEAPAARAYTTAGSFIRFIRETRGAMAVQTLYAHGDFEAATGTTLSALQAEYETFLDTVSVPPEEANQAQARFKARSIFERACVREVARLVALDRSDPHAALARARRCQQLQPEEVSHRRWEATTLRELGRTEEAGAILDELLARLEDSPSEWASVAADRADVAWSASDWAAARRDHQAILDKRPGEALERSAHVHLAALELDPTTRASLSRFFGDPRSRLYALTKLEGTSWVADYLLARALWQGGADADALPILRRVAADPAVPSVVRTEASRMEVEGLFRVKDCAALLAYPSVAGVNARDWAERCSFVTTGRLPD